MSCVSEPSPHGVSLAEAQALLSAAVEVAVTRGHRMAIAIVDVGGHPVAMTRMDGASILAAESVIQKARSAAWLGRPTGSAVDIGKEWPHVYLSFAIAAQGAITWSRGAFPIVLHEGRLLGAIAAAGGTGDQDADVALAALRARKFVSDPTAWPSGPG
jgi:glc operon protein GlcG